MAQETPLAQHFPRTLEALAAAEIVRIDGKPVELFFSRLRPGTHIPPHFGGSNNRITIHLPLIVPGECSIRVGDEFHAWREGELFAFDDSFEHEAWNQADSDRVVLIFESPHPDLSAVERQCVEFAIERRGQWLRERAVPAE
jgi:aspartyl/asparaginyl beta-hydroxylase (cupin superfamily)